MADDVKSEYLSTKEVAVDFPMNEGTLRSWRCANLGPPSYTSGPRGRVYYKRSEVAAWLARQEAATRRGAEVGADPPETPGRNAGGSTAPEVPRGAA